MNNVRNSLLANYIDLLLAENKCTVSDVKDIANLLIDNIKFQKGHTMYKPTTALFLYGITDSARKIIPINTNIDNVDVLKFVNNK